ncbi:MAG TPA: serine O-acetyltransferase [Phycisphaerae bacterium]|nr:serine O-acetyltransferase [Phycisphaerae bacterium]HNU46801.1 serine O-acetyltransferase [Phycisphaerae bacterium]
MSDDFHLGPHLAGLVERMVQSYDSDERIRHIDRMPVPAQSEIVELIDCLLQLLYPGFIGRQDLSRHNVAFHVGALLPRIGELTFRQVYSCLCYAEELEHPDGTRKKPATQRAEQITRKFLEALPGIRTLLAEDVQAAYDGDPAAENLDEVILAYPGLLAVSVHRCAHTLYDLDVPILPRMMSEWAHTKTGIDIHPGARIGKHFFIDHGTGVVIGETTDIGDNVKLYQGVTLGALSFPKDERGRLIRGTKRHPTVRNNATIYANAIILGGETVIGESAVVGGSVFITSSVPAGSVVTFTPPELRVRPRTPASDKAPALPPEAP